MKDHLESKYGNVSYNLGGQEDYKFASSLDYR